MGLLSKSYLVLYNVLQVGGWSYLLALSLPLLDSGAKLYLTVGPVLRVFQTAAVLEVAHAALGLVKSSAAITAFQVASRVLVTWAVVHVVPEAQACPGFPLLLLAWAVTEVIRYSYYTASLLGVDVPPLTWLRYTLFIVLYPIGVTGELWCQYVSLERIGREGMFSVAMPNSWNVTFSFHTALIVCMASYVPIFPMLYMHMFSQRRKIIGGQQPAGKKTK